MTIKSIENSNTEFSKDDHTNLRKHIQIQLFFSPQKRLNEDSIVVYEPNRTTIGTNIIETSRVEISCKGIIPNYLTTNRDHIYYYAKYASINSEATYKFSSISELSQLFPQTYNGKMEYLL